MDKKGSLGNPRVRMQVFEIYNEIIKDLLVPMSGDNGLELKEDAFRGVHIPVSK